MQRKSKISTQEILCLAVFFSCTSKHSLLLLVFGYWCFLFKLMTKQDKNLSGDSREWIGCNQPRRQILIVFLQCNIQFNFKGATAGVLPLYFHVPHTIQKTFKDHREKLLKIKILGHSQELQKKAETSLPLKFSFLISSKWTRKSQKSIQQGISTLENDSFHLQIGRLSPSTSYASL